MSLSIKTGLSTGKTYQTSICVAVYSPNNLRAYLLNSTVLLNDVLVEFSYLVQHKKMENTVSVSSRCQL